MEFITENLFTVYLLGSAVSFILSIIYLAIVYSHNGKIETNIISYLIVAALGSWISAIITIMVCVEVITRSINIEYYEYDSKYLDTSLLVKLREEAQSTYKIHKLKSGAFMVIGDKSTKYWNSEPMFSISDAKREYTRVVIQRMKALVLNLRRESRIIEYSPWDKVTKL